ncbi:hypothetical protein HMSSN139_55280 [Paenibacillus sp. HMSSN-139]|jgi:hypothetical protein|nr:hypothetical protein HMSSN139_55280 [Paenibacillus sp. HMSSN-139]
MRVEEPRSKLWELLGELPTGDMPVTVQLLKRERWTCRSSRFAKHPRRAA